MRWIIRIALACISTPLLIVLYLNIEVLASQRGWDTLLAARFPQMSEFLTQPWVFALATFVIGCTVGMWAVFFLRSRNAPSEEISLDLNDALNQNYRMCTVPIDGKRFIQCSFEDVTFHWEGGGNYEFIDCKYVGRRGISVKGGKLGGLLNLLKILQLLEDSVSKNMQITPRD